MATQSLLILPKGLHVVNIIAAIVVVVVVVEAIVLAAAAVVAKQLRDDIMRRATIPERERR